MRPTTDVRLPIDPPCTLAVPTLPAGTPRSLRALALSSGGLGETVDYRPSRVLLQDFTGVPVLADLAALRDALADRSGDPAALQPAVPVHLVIDHSVSVEVWGQPGAAAENHRREAARSGERTAFLRWAAGAFDRLRVVPSGTGIVHQVNLERLSTVFSAGEDGRVTPDAVVGTDSHTTMAGSLGMLAWGVGGVDALAVLLGDALPMRRPAVVGVRLTGALAAGVTAMDLALTATARLREAGVVGAFVEWFGPGLDALALPDRATLANMAPEYGATASFFPVDGETLRWLAATGRDQAQVALVEAAARAAGLWRDDAESLDFDAVVDVGLGEVVPCVAGPRRPSERVALGALPRVATGLTGGGGLPDGAVVIAAITSCTNTANPAAMIAAALVAKAAAARGLRPAPWVKTSLAPGSRVVADTLGRAGLLGPLAALGFDVVGFGCTTCIGNSGPLAPEVEAALRAGARGAAVLSGNRNFEGRIHPLVSASFLASPPLVVAFALAGRVDLDLTTAPLGTDADGGPVTLAELWPSPAEIAQALAEGQDPGDFSRCYANMAWSVPASSARYPWDPASTFLAPPLIPVEAGGSVRGARALLVLGDAVTTDHISPAGPIPTDSAAGRWLLARGEANLGTYGSRRAHPEVLLRGAFAGGDAAFPGPDGVPWSVYEAGMASVAAGEPLVILAGRAYGMGSSRDQAARVTAWLGVRAVLARSFERIHRANLAAFGVLPLALPQGVALPVGARLDLDVPDALGPGGRVRVTVQPADGAPWSFDATARLETAAEVATWRAGGMLAAAG